MKIQQQQKKGFKEKTNPKKIPTSFNCPTVQLFEQKKFFLLNLIEGIRKKVFSFLGDIELWVLLRLQLYF